LAKNIIDYVEWYVTDLNRAKRFYGDLFDWRFEKYSEEYLIFHPKEGISGGIMKTKEVKAGQSPVVYVAVDEIEPYLKKVEKLGGGVAVPKTEIPNSGWFAWITDPDGNIVGIFEALERK
jgi:predicted enzyme related to lactoylglutathione lyase